MKVRGPWKGRARIRNGGMDANVGEIRLFAFAWAPVGWTRCDGTLLEIERYAALHAVLGTHYGGDGKSTFAVPDLRGRTPVHISTAPDTSELISDVDRDVASDLSCDFNSDLNSNVSLGESGGQHEAILTLGEVPPHTHSVQTDSAAQQSASASQSTRPSSAGTWQIQTAGAQRRTFAVATPDTETSANAAWAAESVSISGQGAAHTNMQPSLVISFCIAVEPVVTTASPQPAITPQSVKTSQKRNVAGQRSVGKQSEVFSHYMGELRLFAGDVLPNGWLPCDGRELSVEEHNTLYSL